MCAKLMDVRRITIVIAHATATRGMSCIKLLIFCQKRHFNKMHYFETPTARNLGGAHSPPHNYLVIIIVCWFVY